MNKNDKERKEIKTNSDNVFFFLCVCVYVFKSYLLVKVFIKIRKTEGLSLFFHLVWLISFAVFKSYYFFFSILVSHRPFFILSSSSPPFLSFTHHSYPTRYLPAWILIFILFFHQQLMRVQTYYFTFFSIVFFIYFLYPLFI